MRHEAPTVLAKRFQHFRGRLHVRVPQAEIEDVLGSALLPELDSDLEHASNPRGLFHLVRELVGVRPPVVEEKPHPTDARRKSFRLVATRIGSSDVPVEQLRGAVKRYVSLAPLAYAVPLDAVLDVLLADGNVDDKQLRAQARALGARTSALFAAASPAEALRALVAFWEREGVATRVVEVHERSALFELAPALSSRPADLVAALLGGSLEGVLRARLGLDMEANARVDGARVTLALRER